MNKIPSAHAVFVALIVASTQLAVFGAPGAKTSQNQDDVVVKKNADGTVETSDAPSASAATAPASGTPQVQYHLRNNVGTRRIGGVLVRTNPDGSIETVDNDSAPAPVHHSARSAAASAHARKTVHPTAKKQHQ